MEVYILIGYCFLKELSQPIYFINIHNIQTMLKELMFYFYWFSIFLNLFRRSGYVQNQTMYFCNVQNNSQKWRDVAEDFLIKYESYICFFLFKWFYTSHFWGLLSLSVRCEPRLCAEDRTLTYNGLLLQIVTWMESCLIGTNTRSFEIYILCFKEVGQISL